MTVRHPPPSPFLKGQFRSLTGRKVGPDLLLILIEAANEGHEAIECAKLSQCNSTVRYIDDTSIELPHHIEHTSSRLVKIPSARIPSIGEELNLKGTAARSPEYEMKIVPGEEWIGGGSGNRQAHLICREVYRGRHRHIVVAGRQQQEESSQVSCWIGPRHLLAGTFETAPIASSPA